MEVGANFWIGFIILVIICLALDMFVFHKKGEIVTVKKALWLSLFWISLALLFNVGIWYFFGKEGALEFFTAYLIEKSLSVDNLFVFIIIFAMFKIKPEHQHDVLFWGILGALVFRAIFIFAGVALIEKFSWIMYVFGLLLVITGIKMGAEVFKKKEEHKEEEKSNAEKNATARFLKKLIPTTDDMSVPAFFRKIDHKIYATPFFIALIVIEVSDLIFAVDSIPAVLSVSTNTFIIFTSNIFAILGLRSLYFALRGIMDYFYYLKYALSAILFFIGCKMIINHYSTAAGLEFHISNIVSLSIIASLLLISILFSIRHSKKVIKADIKDEI